MARKPTPLTVTMPRDTLQRLLTGAAQVAGAGAVPIIADVLLTASGDRLHVVTTDTDMELQESCLAEITAPGCCAVPARLFHQLAAKSSAQDATLALSPDGERLKVGIGRARAALPTLPTEDFPAWTAGDYSHSFGMTAPALSRLLRRVEFAVSTEETRYYLNGVYLHAGGENGQSLRAVATDGHRMVIASTLLPGGAEGMPGIIVPTATVKRILKLFSGENDVEVEVSETSLRLSADGTEGAMVLSSKLIDGTYPDYERVVPTEEGQELEVDRSALLDACRRALAFAADKSRAVKLTFEAELLTIHTATPATGELTEEVDGDGWSGRVMEIGCNAAYLAEALDHMAGSRVRIVVATDDRPIRIQDPGDPDILSVLMPVRI